MDSNRMFINYWKIERGWFGSHCFRYTVKWPAIARLHFQIRIFKLTFIFNYK